MPSLKSLIDAIIDNAKLIGRIVVDLFVDPTISRVLGGLASLSIIVSSAVKLYCLRRRESSKDAAGK
jgi:hypothetical protein